MGTHSIGTLASNAKANSTPTNATLASGAPANALIEFGTPDVNPGGGFGGAALIEGVGELVAIARVTTWDGSVGSDAAEDYNGIRLP